MRGSGAGRLEEPGEVALLGGKASLEVGAGLHVEVALRNRRAAIKIAR